MSNRPFRLIRWCLVAFAALSAPGMAAAKGEFTYGADIFTWSSNFLTSGSEVVTPASFLYRTPSDRIQIRANTAFVSGRYKQKDAGYGEQTFSDSKMTDSTVGLTWMAPLGGFRSSVALSANLPTGSEKWEAQQGVGNVPLIFEETRYRGRGFGFSALYALSRQAGSWNLMGAVGYLYSTSVQPGLAGGSELDLGNSVVAGLNLSKKVGSNGQLGVKVLQSFTQPSQVDGTDAFTSPPSTVVNLALQAGAHFRVDAGMALFGKTKRPDVNGVLVAEDKATYGSRIYLAPSLGYSAGPKVQMSTGLKFKSVAANDYAATEPYYEAGGILFGGAQELKWKMSGNLFTRFGLEYDYISHRRAAYDAAFTLTNVTYDVVSFGTGVGYQW